MAWNPFGVSFELTATAGTAVRISATQYSVAITAHWETYYTGAKTNYGMTAASGGSTVTLNPFGTYASSGTAKWIGTYAISGNGAASKTITVTFRNFNNDNGDSATKAVNVSVTVPAWTSYTVSYNANGGTGAPLAQTKWKNQTLTLSSTRPTRTGYSFQGWASSLGGSVAYAPGASYTANAAVTLYAVWAANTYTVSYNANGGTGAPASQTKTYGVTLTLSSTIPTRTNYTFLGWGVAASSTTPAYSAGAPYGVNAAITLYAVWALAYVKPRITALSVSRCDAQGVKSDDGTYAKIEFDWESDRAISSITVDWESANNGTGTASLTPSGTTSGSESHIFGNGDLSADATYALTLTVTDTNDFSVVYASLSGTNFGIDFLAGGNGAAFNKPAELSGVLDINLVTKFRGGIQNEVLEKYNDLNDVFTPNTYVSVNRGASEYDNCPVDSGTFVLEVMSAGAEGQVFQRLTTTVKGTHETYERHYYQSSWGDWVRVRSGDTGWVDLTLQSGISVGSECGYLKGRLKNGVLYIRGDVTGISANWKLFATVPASLIPDGLATNNRMGAVYNMSYFCGLNLQRSGSLYVSANSAGTWDSTKDVSINIAICGE